MIRNQTRAIGLVALMVLATVAGVATFAGSAAASHGTSDTIIVDGSLESTDATHETSIGAAVEKASSDDVIIVKNGTYGGFLLDKSVTVRAADGAEPNVTGDGAAVVHIDSQSGGDPAGAKVSGLTLKGKADLGVEIRADGVQVTDNVIDMSASTTAVQVQGDGVDGDGVQNVRIAGNTITGTNVGVSLTEHADGVTVENNDISGVALEGIGLATDTATIKGNSISGDAPSIQFYLDYAGANGVKSSEAAVATELIETNALSSVVFNPSGTVIDGGIQNAETGTYYGSIQAAIDAASAGDTIQIAAGTYTESLTVTQNVTLTGAGQSATVIDGGLKVDEPVDGLTLDNLTMKGDRGSSRTFYMDSVTTNVTVSNVTFDGEDSVGFAIYGNAFDEDVTITDSKFVNYNDGSQWGTVYVSTKTGLDEVTFTSNDVADNTAMVTFHGNEKASGSNITALTITDNTFTGTSLGDTGASPAALSVQDSKATTIEDNTFSDNFAHVHHVNASIETQTVVSSNEIEDAAVVFNVSTQSVAPVVYGTLGAAEDDATSGDGVIGLDGSTFEESLTVDTKNLTVVGAGDATITGKVTVKAAEVGLYGLTFEGDRAGPGLAADSGNIAILVRGANANVEAVDVSGYYGGIQVSQGGTDLSVTRSTFDDVAFGIGVMADDAHIRNNTITGELQGVSLLGGNAYVVNNTIAVDDSDLSETELDDGSFDFSDDNVGSRALEVGTYARESDESGPTVEHNTIESTDIGVYVKSDAAPGTTITLNNVTGARYAAYYPGTDSLDLSENYWGSADGPVGQTISEQVRYEPFLTAPQSEVADKPGKVSQFAYDLHATGDGKTAYAVGIPAPTDRTVGEVLNDFAGTVHMYDAEADAWVQPTASTELDALDVLVVVPQKGETARAVVSVAEADGMTSPGEADVAPGWNLVTPPQSGGADTAFGAATADPERVLDSFANPDEAPDDRFDKDTIDEGDSEAVTMTSGYWVYMDKDGTVAVNVQDGATVDSFIDYVSPEAHLIS